MQNVTEDSTVVGMEITNDHRVEQVVMHGNVNRALGKKFFSSGDLLCWLAENDPPLNSDLWKYMVAYKSLCEIQQGFTHYCSDGEHLVVKHPTYLPIYLGMKIRTDIPSKLGCGEHSMLSSYCTRDTYANNVPDESIAFAKIIFGTKSNISLHRLVAGQRIGKIRASARVTTNQYPDRDMLETDWTDRFSITNSSSCKAMIDRIEYLQEHAPDYYNQVVKESYFRLIDDAKCSKKLPNDKEILIKIRDLFPGTISDNFESYSDLALKISNMPIELAGYYLGFPIHEVQPSEEQLEAALLKLTEEGQDDYLQSVYRWNDGRIPSIINHMGNIAEVINKEDLLTYAIREYSPYDIINCVQGKHCYQFTRSEFKSIVDKDQNPYNNQEIPWSVTYAMTTRMEVADNCEFPPSKPLAELYEDLLNGAEVERSENVLGLVDPSIIGEPSEDVGEIDVRRPFNWVNNLTRSVTGEDMRRYQMAFGLRAIMDEMGDSPMRHLPEMDNVTDDEGIPELTIPDSTGGSDVERAMLEIIDQWTNYMNQIE